ncbi:MAG: hypothetical protein HKO59_08295, partial [Phycisphaerales bacterium]|nr:hypothetical protein [Phycisphaerales bacterium]
MKRPPSGISVSRATPPGPAADQATQLREIIARHEADPPDGGGGVATILPPSTPTGAVSFRPRPQIRPTPPPPLPVTAPVATPTAQPA